MAVQVKNLPIEQIDIICRAIGDSFYDHDYGEREKGICKLIDDREMMFQYMKAIFVAGVKSGTIYSTSEQGEGYIMLSGSKWEKMKIGPAIVLLKDMIKALGGFPSALQFLKDIKVGGIPLDDKFKKEKKDYLKVEMLVVLKEYQGQGYMRQLIEFAYEKADEYGVPCILDTDAKNKLDKYCHLGMKHVATRKLAGDCYLYDLMREVQDVN
ncbi:MAG: GNAT family N-acetyltransferase [Lachnospiraceae bacterium]|nr:GNAT family N-acetyltransferase [Lachnospiraceae bacterium]